MTQSNYKRAAVCAVAASAVIPGALSSSNQPPTTGVGLPTCSTPNTFDTALPACTAHSQPLTEGLSQTVPDLSAATSGEPAVTIDTRSVDDRKTPASNREAAPPDFTKDDCRLVVQTFGGIGCGALQRLVELCRAALGDESPSDVMFAHQASTAPLKHGVIVNEETLKHFLQLDMAYNQDASKHAKTVHRLQQTISRLQHEINRLAYVNGQLRIAWWIDLVGLVGDIITVIFPTLLASAALACYVIQLRSFRARVLLRLEEIGREMAEVAGRYPDLLPVSEKLQQVLEQCRP